MAPPTSLSGFLDQKAIDELQTYMDNVQKSNSAKEKLLIMFKEVTFLEYDKPLDTLPQIGDYIRDLKDLIDGRNGEYFESFTRLENSYLNKILGM